MNIDIHSSVMLIVEYTKLKTLVNGYLPLVQIKEFYFFLNVYSKLLLLFDIFSTLKIELVC
jgi:hypothetical protein